MLGEIIAAAIAAEGGSTDEVMGPSRKRSPSRSRQAAMWLAFKITPHSLQAIGDAVGRHHSTVLYGIRAYERRLAEDANARARSECLLNRFTTENNETEGARS
jgi:chromosomal replication initiation ATPase DnaA